MLVRSFPLKNRKKDRLVTYLIVLPHMRTFLMTSLMYTAGHKTWKQSRSSFCRISNVDFQQTQINRAHNCGVFLSFKGTRLRFGGGKNCQGFALMNYLIFLFILVMMCPFHYLFSSAV